jgi:hypothetical protein
VLRHPVTPNAVTIEAIVNTKREDISLLLNMRFALRENE